MPISSASATAHPNIALIKYWGDIDPELHIPANSSISMNLAELTTRTEVSFDTDLSMDEFILNGEKAQDKPQERVSSFLNIVRQLAGISTFAKVESQNNFPIGVGVASSASGFAALSLAASCAAGLVLDEKDLSRLARIGSGSACRSIPGGIVEWQAGNNDGDSYAYTIAPPNYWNLVDCIALVSREEKQISSKVGHSLASTSVLQTVRLADAPRRLKQCHKAILERNFDALADIVELDSNLMHAVMITSTPSLLYWHPATVKIMQAVQAWRKEGLAVCYTIDAGPNVHVLGMGVHEEEISERLRQLSGVIQVLIAHLGEAATVDESQTRQEKTRG